MALSFIVLSLMNGVRQGTSGASQSSEEELCSTCDNEAAWTPSPPHPQVKAGGENGQEFLHTSGLRPRTSAEVWP